MSSDLRLFAADVKFDEKDVVGYEGRHVFYTKHHEGRSDMLFVKEYIHLKDGRRLINLRKIFDHPRSYWVTKPTFRNHADHLEWVDLNEVDRFECPQWELAEHAANTLRYRGHRRDLRTLAATNHLYGTDISSQALLRQQYKDNFPKCVFPKSSMAAFDIETEEVKGHKYPIIVQASFKDRAIIRVLRSFLDGHSLINAEDMFFEMCEKLIGDRLRKRGLTRENIDFEICDSPGECVADVVARLHVWKPDYVNVWNINFDLPRIIRALEEEQYCLEDVFCDPEVPPEYRYFKYCVGKDTHVSQDGKEKKLKYFEQWHTVDCPASFQWIDGMCYYYQRRKTGGMMKVGLDACLERHTFNKKTGEYEGKLSIEGVVDQGIDWHIVMQRDHKFEYLAYALWDGPSLEILDEHTTDVVVSLTNDIAYSDLKSVPSLPKQLADALHYHLLKNGKVISSTSNDMKTDIDGILVDPDAWIATLAAHLMQDNGLPVFIDAPHLKSSIYIHGADADIVGTYPNLGIACNVARETTYKEVTIRMVGMTEDARRQWGINLTGGKVNAIELGTTGMGLPFPEEWLAAYDESMALRSMT